MFFQHHHTSHQTSHQTSCVFDTLTTTTKYFTLFNIASHTLDDEDYDDDDTLIMHI